MSDLSPIPATEKVDLTRAEKAAIVVRFLLTQGATLNLSDLPDHLQARLTQQMGAMRYIDRRTLATVMTEFAQELEDIGLSFPSGLVQAIAALDGKISPLTAARLRSEAGVKEAGDPWARVADLELDELVKIAQRESVEVAAILISKLPVAKAAELLGNLPGPLARKVTLAVGKTASSTPDAVERIGVSLAAQLDDVPERAFPQSADARVGAILNQANAQTRQDLLDGLQEVDKSFADSVLRNVFTFAHIPARVAARDVPTVLRAVAQDQLQAALAGANEGDDAAARDFLLSNLPKRLAENLREEIAENDPPDPDIAEKAMLQVIAAIQTLAESGDIKLGT
jgi:flagellar motor switch protein FliG